MHIELLLFFSVSIGERDILRDDGVLMNLSIEGNQDFGVGLRFKAWDAS